jgi:hypothetical protein
MLSVDHISQPVMFLPILRETAVIRSSLATTALPLASCPVTIRLTTSVMAFLHFRCEWARRSEPRPDPGW